MSHQAQRVPRPAPNPAREQPFKAAERADALSDLLFYAGAGLSFVVLFVEETRTVRSMQAC